ncbi:MAG: LapA family protein [Hyphomicrobiales bacterium]|nr:LapA family protein [Hyphomicrobiales bacterium]
MRRIAFYVLVVPLAILLIVGFVANRHLVVLSIDPFSAASSTLSVSVPLFVLLFVALVLGVLVGGMAAWFGQGRWRRLARDEKAEIDRLRLDAKSRPGPAPAPAPALPAIRDAG